MVVLGLAWQRRSSAPVPASRSGAAARRRMKPRRRSSPRQAPRVETRQVDVADRATVQSAFAETLQTFVRVDACFANSGIGGGGRRSFIERTEDEWRGQFSINLHGAFPVFPGGATHQQE